MRLLLINYEYPPLGGGAATASFHLAAALAAFGDTITVLTSRPPRGAPPTPELPGVTVVAVPARRRHCHEAGLASMAAFTLAALPRLGGLAGESDGVIVFFTLPCGPLAWLARRLRGRPYVVSLRGGDVPGLVPELDRLHRILRPLRRLVLRGACAVVANSPGLRDLSEKADPIPVAFIPNGVDAALFQPAAVAPFSDPSRRCILFVGRLHEQKNLPLLLGEFAAARARNAALRLTVAGDGALLPALQAEAARLGVADAVEWRGWVSREAMPGLLRSADVFVNPSQYEGMPNAVLEAMAAGLPVVASNVPGNDVLVANGVTGFLVPLGQPGCFADRFTELAADPGLARRMGAAARQKVVEEFSWAAVARGYRSFFTPAAREPSLAAASAS